MKQTQGMGLNMIVSGIDDSRAAAVVRSVLTRAWGFWSEEEAFEEERKKQEGTA